MDRNEISKRLHRIEKEVKKKSNESKDYPHLGKTIKCDYCNKEVLLLNQPISVIPHAIVRREEDKVISLLCGKKTVDKIGFQSKPDWYKEICE